RAMAQDDARAMRSVRQQQEGQLFQGAAPAPQEPSRRAESFLRGRRIVADRDLSHAQGRYEVPGSRKGSFRQAPDQGQGQPPPRPTRQAGLSGRSPAPHERRLMPANLHGATSFFLEGQLFQGAVPAPQEPSRRAESFLRGRRIVADRDLSHAQGRYEVPGSRKGSFRQAPDQGQGQPPPRPTRQAGLSGRSPAPHERRLMPANLHGATSFFLLRKGAPWLKTTLVQCAVSASNKKDSYFRAQFLRLKSRRGAPIAFCAVAASLLTAIYHMLRDGTKFRDLGKDHFDKRPTKAKVNRLLAQLAKLGYQAD